MQRLAFLAIGQDANGLVRTEMRSIVLVRYLNLPQLPLNHLSGRAAETE